MLPTHTIGNRDTFLGELVGKMPYFLGKKHFPEKKLSNPSEIGKTEFLAPFLALIFVGFSYSSSWLKCHYFLQSGFIFKFMICTAEAVDFFESLRHSRQPQSGKSYNT